MPIICVERVIVAVTDLATACERWSTVGFGVARDRFIAPSIEVARLHAGAVEIDLCAFHAGQNPELFNPIIARGGGLIGWTWGIAGSDQAEASGISLTLPFEGGARRVWFLNFLPGVWTGAIESDPDPAKRRDSLKQACGTNQNTVDYIDHIVVMTPSLETAIAAHENLGVPCKRVRDAGGGVKQAFFKLEQTVLEIAGPGRGEPQVWGLAFMCDDIQRAVEIARANGFEATTPKTATQGGKIARLVNLLDGVAIAYMEAD